MAGYRGVGDGLGEACEVVGDGDEEGEGTEEIDKLTDLDLDRVTLGESKAETLVAAVAVDDALSDSILLDELEGKKLIEEETLPLADAVGDTN